MDSKLRAESRVKCSLWQPFCKLLYLWAWCNLTKPRGQETCLLCFYTLDSHKTPWRVKTAVRRTIICAIFEYVLYKVVIIQLWLLFLYFLWVCNCKLHWHPSTDYFSLPLPRHPDPSYRPTFSTLLLTLNNLYGSVITWSHSQSRPEFFIGELLSLGARLHEDLQNAYQV